MLVSRSYILLALLVAITPSSAQTTGNFSTCGQACLTDIIGGSICKTITNVTCICTETTVQDSLGACLQNCSAADLAEGQSLETNLCSNTTSSTTTSPSASQASVTRSSSSSSSTSTSTSASSGNNAASPVEQLPLISTIIAIAGVVIGGAFAL